MARGGFKRWWTRIVPPSVERSTYVLASTLVLALLFWQWRPMTDVVWKVNAAPNVFLIHLVFWLGWGTALISTFLINHFELFGLSQVFARVTTGDLPASQFKTPLVYRYVRHPLYVGFLLAFWAAPTMTTGHLMFAIGMTGYILLGIFLEERDLIRLFGETLSDVIGSRSRSSCRCHCGRGASTRLWRQGIEHLTARAVNGGTEYESGCCNENDPDGRNVGAVRRSRQHL